MTTEEERELKAKKKVYRQRYYNKLKNTNPTVAQQYSRNWWIRNKDTWKAKSKLAIKNPVDTFNAESSYKVSFEGVDDTSDPKLFLELLKKRNE
jgi:Zn-dependent peptidase ImmA (M78 family)